MSKPSFVYVTYIASTPEKLWQALTDAKMAQKFWFGYGVEFEQRVGAPFTMEKDGNVVVSGEVLECAAPRRLSYTFHAQHDGLEREKPSRVLFDIEGVEGQVKLTVTHDDFEPDSKVFERIRGGWPAILSSLKSLLETGQGLTWFGEYPKPTLARSAAR